MTPLWSHPVDRVDRIVPRVQDRSEPRKRDGHPVKDSGERDKDKKAPSPTRKPHADEDDDHTIDLLVQGRCLPTRQMLPGRSGAALIN
jgi:hypothetical protein